MTNYNLLANAIRILSADAVENAKSGHPGMPMGMAEIATVLWKNHLKHNPINPKWFNRDRFILSNGHGSMLIYSLLHLAGYNLSIEDIKQFRQLGSKTPGHPEYGYIDGVETTTGPLGQGLANSVGMALAEKLLSHEFNKDGFNIVDHHTYTFIGDGCLMEGVSHEVCSLAGTLELGKLIVFYDDNGISIDGEVKDWFTENVATRFKAYNWQVIDNVDGHNIEEINEAIAQAKQNKDQPTIIICKTIIGKGSPNKAGKEECHGAPLGADEIGLIRQKFGWEFEPFQIPQDVYTQFDGKESGNKLEFAWNQLFAEYKNKYPHFAAEFERRMNHRLPDNWDSIIHQAALDANGKKETIATRKASQNAIEYFAQYLPEFFGGSADLTGSNLTKWKNAITLDESNNFTGNYISYGVREFGMSAILNGIFLHGGYRPFGGTFLMFSEYARNAIRMASLMKIAPIFVYTHDSIGLGEDGPTHQPVEQLATLRVIPNMQVWRPCDTVETNVAWGVAISQTTSPSSLIFSRQNLKFIDRDLETIKNISRGGYILRKNSDNPEILIIATGSEVELALSTYEALCNSGNKVQLVSMPSTSIFDKQDISYKNKVLPNTRYKVAIEAGVADTWYKYIG
ncbi:MAG: transketolase, partial [Neisseriaceae bacterium]